MNSHYTSPPAPIFPSPNTECVKRANLLPIVTGVTIFVVAVIIVYYSFISSTSTREKAPFSSNSAPALGSARSILARAPSGVIEPPATPTVVAEPEVKRIHKVQKEASARSIELREKALASTGVVPVVNQQARALRESALPQARNLSNSRLQNADVDSRIQALLAAQGGADGEPNDQVHKEAFLSSQRDDFRLDSPMVEPQGFREIKTGSVIPALLLTGINSDLPGELVGQVSSDVFDSRSGDVLLIPAGAKLFGRYDSQVVYGQSRVLVAWDRLVHPDGRAISLKSMSGGDISGAAGFADEVHNHYGKIFGSALLMSI